MKKLFTLILALLMTLSFASCGGECPEKATPDNPTIEPNTPEVVTPVPPDDGETVQIAVERRVYECPNYHECDERSFIFNTKQELEAFCEANAENLGDEFAEFVSKYDDAYFVDRSLICVYFMPTVNLGFGDESQFVKMGSRYYLTLSHVIKEIPDVVTPAVTRYDPIYALYEPEAGYKFTESDFVLYWSP